jgi:nucleotide-binding universal stress UspA family protein
MTTPRPERIILCGTDFSDAARAAAELAAALAAAMNARLRLVHVIDPAPLRWLGPRDQDLVREAALVALDAEVARLGRDHARPIDRALLEGAPGRAIATAATELGATLIVVAAVSQASSILQVGGTAERVAQAATVPVLLARDPAPLQRWLAGERLAVAALLADDAASERAVEWLRVLRQLGACDVAALRGYYVDEEARRYGLVPRPVVQADRDIEAYLIRDLRVQVGGLDGRGGVSFHPVLAIGRMADHLLADPAAVRADLLVVGNHRRRGLARLSSVAAGVLVAARASVLVVPAAAAELAPAPWPAVRRVVVATDFSSFADAAIRHAYGLVAGGGGQVVLLHVMTEPGAEQGRSDALARLRERAPAHPPHGVVTEVEALWHEDAAAGISAVAARVCADVVVVSSHGRSGLRGALIGSVAKKVVEREPRPVLIVRPPHDV